MSLLLDTHVVLWWLADSLELPDELKDRIDIERDVRVSAATIWEIAIKQAIGKIAAPLDLPERVRDSGFRDLSINFAHAMIAARLPMIHRDPFDRMLVAQARYEGLTFVTRDPVARQGWRTPPGDSLVMCPTIALAIIGALAPDDHQQVQIASIEWPVSARLGRDRVGQK